MQKSNLEIVWNPIKEGKAVKKIEFHFRDKPQAELDLVPCVPLDAQV
jgi:plasmid replication initiation protein